MELEITAKQINYDRAKPQWQPQIWVQLNDEQLKQNVKRSNKQEKKLEVTHQPQNGMTLTCNKSIAIEDPVEKLDSFDKTENSRSYSPITNHVTSYADFNHCKHLLKILIRTHNSKYLMAIYVFFLLGPMYSPTTRHLQCGADKLHHSSTLDLITQLFHFRFLIYWHVSYRA